MIQNICLIHEQIKEFSLENIGLIDKFVLNFQNKFSEDHCFLDIDFSIKNKQKQHIARFRFHDPDHIDFASGGIYHQISIAIYDITDRDWGRKKFEVIDQEEHTLHFYCSAIEIISVREVV